MKKMLALLLTVLLLVSLVPVTALATGEDTCAHQWDWTKGVCKLCDAECDHPVTEKKYPNCASGGYVTTRCAVCHKTMGSTGYETVEPGTHTYVNGVCAKCGWEEPAAPCVHTWDWQTGACTQCKVICKHSDSEFIYPNCLEGGKITERCANCHYVLGFDEVAPGEHTFKNGFCTKCGTEEPEKECEHDWNWTTGKCNLCKRVCTHPEYKLIYPVCTDGGYITKKCTTCGNTDPNPIKVTSKPHTFKNGVCTVCGSEEPDPDCVHEWDWITGKCTKCQVYCEHKKSEFIYPQDCLAGGYVTERCAECHYKLGHDPIEPKDHVFKNGVCTVCGMEEPDPNCEHAWDMTTGKCDKCGDHCKHAEFELIYPQNCVEGGHITKRCKECHYFLGNTPVGPTDHTFVNGVCTKCGEKEPAGECTHAWSKEGKCTKCGAECAHKDQKTTLTATCMKDGYETVICKTCNKILATNAVAALGHNFKNGVCQRCGYEEVIVPDPKHDGCLNPLICNGKPVAESVKYDATCTRPGKHETVYPCSLVVVKDIPAKGHTEVVIPGYPATCGKHGLSDGKKCSVCGVTLVEQVLIPATGKHTFKDGVCTGCGTDDPSYVPAVPKHDGCLNPDKCDGNPVLITVRKEATCAQAGQTEIVYACGKIVFKTISKLPHVVSRITIDPTCTEDGKQYSVCVNCGEEKGTAVITPALGHNFIRNKTIKKATCNVGGIDEYICSNCRETKEVATEATGKHLFVFGTCIVCGLKDSDYVPTTPTIPDEPEHECDHGLLSTDLVGLDIQKNPTCTETGLRALYQCKHCGKFFCMLRDGMKEIASIEDRIVIPALGHDFVDGVCTRCGMNAADLDDVPKTGSNPIVVMSALTVVAMVGVIAFVYEKKRRTF